MLIDAVWHHLTELERENALKKIAPLIKFQGRCAISLRNGPAGMGTRVFATNANDTINLFENLVLTVFSNWVIKRVCFLIKFRLNGLV